MAWAVVLTLLSLAERSDACDCSGPFEPFEELVKAKQVFEAQLLYELPHELNSDDCPWQVKMLRAWKGTTTKKDAPVVNSCWCAKRGLEAGKSYIFYTHGSATGQRNIFMCSRVVSSDQAAEDLAELGEPTDVRSPGQPLPVGKAGKPKLPPSDKPLRRWQPTGVSGPLP